MVELITELNNIKGKMEVGTLNDIKYFLKILIPSLVEIFTHFTKNEGNDASTIFFSYQARMAIMDIFLRMVYDESLTEIYHLILNLYALFNFYLILLGYHLC